MADLPPYPDSSGDTGDEPDRGSSTSTPRWVKVFGIIGLVLVLRFVIMMFTGGGGHGPGRHTPAAEAGGDTLASSVTDDQTPSGGDLGDHAPPEGGHL